MLIRGGYIYCLCHIFQELCLFGCLRLLNFEYLTKIIANLLVISIIEVKSTFGYSVSTSIIEKKVLWLRLFRCLRLFIFLKIPMPTIIKVPTFIGNLRVCTPVVIISLQHIQGHLSNALLPQQ